MHPLPNEFLKTVAYSALRILEVPVRLNKNSKRDRIALARKIWIRFCLVKE